jgi:hypothetical protein
MPDRNHNYHNYMIKLKWVAIFKEQLTISAGMIFSLTTFSKFSMSLDCRFPDLSRCSRTETFTRNLLLPWVESLWFTQPQQYQSSSRLRWHVTFLNDMQHYAVTYIQHIAHTQTTTLCSDIHTAHCTHSHNNNMQWHTYSTLHTLTQQHKLSLPLDWFI